MPKPESNEFENKIKEIIEKRKSVFCPIINSMCRIDCEAFEMPTVEVVRTKAKSHANQCCEWLKESPTDVGLVFTGLTNDPPAHSYISGGVCTHFLLRKRDNVEIDFTW